MKFSDFSKDYEKMFPKVERVTSKVVQTPTKPKDIENEINEEIIDNSLIDDTLTNTTKIEERKENDGNDIGTDSESNIE